MVKDDLFLKQNITSFLYKVLCDVGIDIKYDVGNHKPAECLVFLLHPCKKLHSTLEKVLYANF